MVSFRACAAAVVIAALAAAAPCLAQSPNSLDPAAETLLGKRAPEMAMAPSLLREDRAYPRGEPAVFGGITVASAHAVADSETFPGVRLVKMRVPLSLWSSQLGRQRVLSWMRTLALDPHFFLPEGGSKTVEGTCSRLGMPKCKFGPDYVDVSAAFRCEKTSP